LGRGGDHIWAADALRVGCLRAAPQFRAFGAAVGDAGYRRVFLKYSGRGVDGIKTGRALEPSAWPLRYPRRPHRAGSPFQGAGAPPARAGHRPEARTFDGSALMEMPAESDWRLGEWVPIDQKLAVPVIDIVSSNRMPFCSIVWQALQVLCALVSRRCEWL
jgi:hypothetical protein